MITINSRDQYEIIGFLKTSHFIKQPCNRVYPKKC